MSNTKPPFFLYTNIGHVSEETRAPTACMVGQAIPAYIPPASPMGRIKSESISPLTTFITPNANHRGTPRPLARSIGPLTSDPHDRHGSNSAGPTESPSIRFYTPHWGQQSPSVPFAPMASMINMPIPYSAPFSAPVVNEATQQANIVSPSQSAPWSPAFPPYPFTVNQYVPWLQRANVPSPSTPMFVEPPEGARRHTARSINQRILSPRQVTNNISDGGYSTDVETEVSSILAQQAEQRTFNRRPWAAKSEPTTTLAQSTTLPAAATAGRYNLRSRGKKATVIRRLIVPDKPPTKSKAVKGAAKGAASKASEVSGVTKKKNMRKTHANVRLDAPKRRARSEKSAVQEAKEVDALSGLAKRVREPRQKTRLSTRKPRK